MLNSQYNRDIYMRYFSKRKEEYLYQILICSIAIIAWVLVLRTYKFNRTIITTLIILAIVGISIHLIASIFRYYDVSRLISYGFSIRQVDIVVSKIKNREVNDIYCTMYIDSIGTKIEIGNRYKICY